MVKFASKITLAELQSRFEESKTGDKEMVFRRLLQ